MGAAAVIAASAPTSMSDAVSTLAGFVSNVLAIITGNPVLMVMFCAPVLGAAVGVVRRLRR